MLRYLKGLLNKVHSFKSSKWNLEPKYRLFFINEAGDRIRLDKFPENVLDFYLHRNFGKTIYYGRSVLLKEGDIILLVIRRYETNKQMSILERAGVLRARYFRFNSAGDFEEIIDWDRSKEYYHYFVRLT